LDEIIRVRDELNEYKKAKRRNNYLERD
jgi:hypothetical protein